MLNHAPSRGFVHALRRLGWLAVLPLLWQGPAMAGAEAGTVIRNQAVLIWQDAAGQTQHTTTNTVALTVQAVFDATLAGDQRRYVTWGRDAVFPHQLINTGNAGDSFCLSASAAITNTVALPNMRLFQDTDGNGDISHADIEIWTSGGPGLVSLAPGQRMALLLVVDAPSTGSDGTELTAILRAEARRGTAACVPASVRDIGANSDGAHGTNHDRLILTRGAAPVVMKQGSYLPGAPGVADDRIRYTLTLRNEGAVATTTLNWRDDLPAQASLLPATVVVNGGTLSNPVYTASSLSGQLSLAAEAEMTISFEVDLADTITAETVIENRWRVSGDLNGDGTADGDLWSNTTSHAPAQSYGVLLSDTGAGAGPANDGGDDDASLDDAQTMDAAPVHGAQRFDLRLSNTGTVASRYTLRADLSGLPAGSHVVWWRGDGAAILGDDDGDGLADSPVVPAGGTVTLRAMLVLGGAPGHLPVDVPVRAVAQHDVAVSDDAMLRLRSLARHGVDVAFGAVAGFGDAQLVDAHAVGAHAETVAIAPDSTRSLVIHVANEGQEADLFVAELFGDAAATQPLNGAWTASFAGAPSVLLAPGATGTLTLNLRAAIPLPPTAAVFIRLRGVNTLVSNMAEARLTQNGQAIVTLAVDQTQPIAPCGSARFGHKLANIGVGPALVSLSVTAEGSIGGVLLLPTALGGGMPMAELPLSELAAGDDVAIFEAISGAHVLRALEPGPAVRLLPGDFMLFGAQAQVPCHLAAGAQAALVIAASGPGLTPVSVRDSVLVSPSVLQVTKHGARDSACDGIPDSGWAESGLGAQPGECVLWQLALANTGTETVCDVVLRDEAPPFSRLHGGPTALNLPAGAVQDCSISGNAMACRLGSAIDISGDHIPENHCMRAGEMASFKFSVRVQ